MRGTVNFDFHTGRPRPARDLRVTGDAVERCLGRGRDRKRDEHPKDAALSFLSGEEAVGGYDKRGGAARKQLVVVRRGKERIGGYERGVKRLCVFRSKGRKEVSHNHLGR